MAESAQTEHTLSFEERYDSIVHEIEKRRSKWTLASVDFDDVKQIILIHVSRKLHLFNPKKITGDQTTGFVRWLNAVISSQISHVMRQNLRKWARPCVSNTENPRGCPFNSGEDNCSQTPSGKQCSECPIYAKWEKKKVAQFNTRQTLPLDNHTQEVHNIIEDFADVAKSKEIIDRAVLAKLNKHEQRMYRMLFIRGMDERKVGKALGYRRTGHMYNGYGIILKFKHKVIRLARLVIEQEGLA